MKCRFCELVVGQKITFTDGRSGCNTCGHIEDNFSGAALYKGLYGGNHIFIMLEEHKCTNCGNQHETRAVRCEHLVLNMKGTKTNEREY